MDSSKDKALLLSLLPGEIRNQIFELCIDDALSRPKPYSQRTALYGKKPKPRKFTVCVLPQWSGPGSMRTDGIGSLPLLFINKQISQEVLSLVYSKVEEVSIGPYGLQYSDEDPNIRWECAYKLLRTRPKLLLYIKNITLHLPRLQRDLLCNYWRSMGNPKWQAPLRSHAFSVIPELAKLLRDCPSLTSLQVTLVAEVSPPPSMEPLLLLFDLCGHRTTVEILHPATKIVLTSYRRFGQYSIGLDPTLTWNTAWKDLLVKSGRAVMT